MKLHEKQFVRHASGHSPVDKEGFLGKKGETRPTYQRRWFSLRGNLLFYYEKRGDPGPLGVIVLEGCSVQLCESSAGDFAFAIVFQGPGLRTYKLTAEDQHEQDVSMQLLVLSPTSLMSQPCSFTALQRGGPRDCTPLPARAARDLNYYNLTTG
ncbi:Sesquipedalian-1 [Acipenser ruthenus]|uniref:Sesquipedalian-1 n=1 Tax=Acipenser ruthenus TaxID=7906 RepID=A0A444V7K9_ACIRT|nr:Sesquipedalian-1 [Acipenser ruthenus]